MVYGCKCKGELIFLSSVFAHHDLTFSSLLFLAQFFPFLCTFILFFSCFFIPFTLHLCPLSSLLFPLNSLAVRPITPHPCIYFYTFYLFLQPYLLKYLLTLFLCHKATAIYTPIHTKAGGMDSEVWLGVVLGVWDKPSLTRFTSLSRTISPPSNLWRVQGSIPFGAYFVRAHPPAEEKKKLWDFTQSDGHVCLGSC